MQGILDRLEEPGRGGRFASRIVLAACLLYALGFIAFHPSVVTVNDESQYMRQAELVLEGTASVLKVNALTGETERHYPSRYPCGTALLMAIPVAIAGPGGAFVVPCLGLLAGTLLLGRWLQQEGRSPLFALLLLGFPPALVIGRIAMSDAVSVFIITLGLWLFWRGIERGWLWWLGSGFVAGASLLFRESNPIPFAPFFAGALLRRDRNTWALVVGGLAGLSLRFGANAYYFGDPLHYRSAYILAVGSMMERLPMYALATLVFVPAGLLLALLYRGPRWIELCVAVAGFVTAYVVQTYAPYTSLIKNMVLTPRYVLVIVPLIAFGMAESLPRLWRRWLEGVPSERRPALRTAAGVVLASWAAAVVVASFVVHPAHARWSASQGGIRDAIVATIDPEAVVVSNVRATKKFLPVLDLKFVPVERSQIDVETANSLVERYGEMYVVFLDRSDSAYWREDSEANATFLHEVKPTPELIFDQRFSSSDHLRIWRVRRDGSQLGTGSR